MGKSDFVAQQLAAIQSGQTQVISDALGATFDEGALEQKASDGTLTQGDVDAAVAAAVAPLNAQIADLTAKDAADVQALADAQAKAVSDLAALQGLLDAAVSADVADKALVSNLQGSIAAVQTSLDAIKAAVAAVLNPPSP